MDARSKTKRAGTEGMGYTCSLTRERMKTNTIKMIVVVDAVVFVAVVVAAAAWLPHSPSSSASS